MTLQTSSDVKDLERLKEIRSMIDEIKDVSEKDYWDALTKISDDKVTRYIVLQCRFNELYISLSNRGVL